MDVRLAKTLFRWAKGNDTNKQLLESSLNESIQAVMEGKGATMQSATGNGVSVNLASGSMTVSQWVSTVSYALELLEAGAIPPTQIRGRIA